MKKVYIKITDEYIYLYENKKLKTFESKYIKNSSIDNIELFSKYISSIINEKGLKKQYIIIVNNLLNTSELFTYKYAIGKSNILYYKIIQDKDLLKESISKEYIIVFSWTNSTTMMYKLNKEIYIEPLSNKLIDKLKKKYILLIGDTNIKKKFKLPILISEHYDINVFNYI